MAIVLTSGTTGTPKGAVFTNRGLAAVTEGDVGDRWGGGTDMIASTQFAHVGFMTKLPGQLRTGTTSHLLDRWRAADVLDLVERHRIPVLGAVAPQVALMLRDERFDERDLSSVQGLIVGAGPSPPDLVREARERFGCGYSIRYSSTESGGVGLATAFDAPDEEALHTVGRPRAQVRVEIRDDDAGAPVADGEVGELWLSSPTMLDRYWRAPDETAATIVDGWYRTGDLGLVDPTGCIRLAGRRKEMFIRGGYNVYPMEVEAVLGRHPAVAEVAVVPRDDDVMGEIGVAVVVPRDPDAAARPGRPARLRPPGAERLQAPRGHACRSTSCRSPPPTSSTDRRCAPRSRSASSGALHGLGPPGNDPDRSRRSHAVNSQTVGGDGRRLVFLAGMVAAGVGLAVAELMAGLSSQVPSLVAAVGDVFVDGAPGDVVDVAIRSVGSTDKPLLLAAIVIVTLLVGGRLATASLERWWIGPLGIGIWTLIAPGPGPAIR